MSIASENPQTATLKYGVYAAGEVGVYVDGVTAANGCSIRVGVYSRLVS